MIIKRRNFFLILILIVVMPIIAAKLTWINSAVRTKGVTAFEGMDIAGQLQRHYSVIMFSATGRDTVFFNSSDNELFEPGQSLSVLYQPANPTDARVNTFSSLWMDTVIYSSLFFLFIAIVFLHPEIIPYQSKIQLMRRRPFIQLI
ncbi:MAG TPA: DUF3592 domain-containing protein [Agriterribacter sp.]|nr:DUF3592 domain-containing protein [Agriterribacter sp.]